MGQGADPVLKFTSDGTLHAATTFFAGQNLQARSMKNRFKLEAWVMVLFPIVILLVGLLAAIAFGMLGSRH